MAWYRVIELLKTEYGAEPLQAGQFLLPDKHFKFLTPILCLYVLTMCCVQGSPIYPVNMNDKEGDNSGLHWTHAAIRPSLKQ